MSSFARVYSAQTEYLGGIIISIEVDILPGLHNFSIVGLGDKAVEESKDRVGIALRNMGFTSPKQQNQKIIVSLAPADIKKEGAIFDLGIALAYLLSKEEIIFDPTDKVFVGELTLDGNLRPIKGALALAETAQKAGFKEIYLPIENAEEAALVDGINVYGLKNLKEATDHLDKLNNFKLNHFCLTEINLDEGIKTTCFSEIRGQEIAKRALMIAAAGGHNIAMIGSPGTGKTMLARAFTGILPAPDRNTSLEITRIHSIAGELDKIPVTNVPFRSPHHTSSYVSVIGGGGKPKPGEVTLAHKGVLFMDEFPEFDKRVLESLRQPLEDGFVSISRAQGSAKFPTEFILVAAMNPPDPNATSLEKNRFSRKISGPIMDRIDLWVSVEKIDYDLLGKISNDKKGQTSTDILNKVKNARQNQINKLNSRLTAKEIANLEIEDSAEKILKQSAEKLSLSPRSYHRVIKVAKTIADLEESNIIKSNHILEALQYRPKNISYFKD